MAEGGTSDSLSDLLDKLIVNWEEVIQSTSQQTLCEYKKLSEELSSYLTRDCLTKLAKVLQNLKPMTLVDYVHSKLQNLAKDQPEADADVWQYGKTFSQVKQIMDSTLAVPSSAVTETDASDETAEHIIKWSLELWLLSRFQCESESGPVKTWTLLQGCRIFKKYIKEDMPGGERKRFYVLVENDCKDLVEQLFKHELAGEKFEEYLKDRREVMKLSELDISTDMVKIVSEKSHTYYIIPKNNENNKMYGAFVYLMRTENQPEPIISLHGGKAEEMRDLMKNAGFNQFLDFLPFTWTFPKLLSDLKQKLSEINCTMLFLSFFTHGCNGYISDTMNGFIKVEEILEIMNSSPELKRIPKVSVGIQQSALQPQPQVTDISPMHVSPTTIRQSYFAKNILPILFCKLHFANADLILPISLLTITNHQ